jgi:hypothetical protein
MKNSRIKKIIFATVVVMTVLAIGLALPLGTQAEDTVPSLWTDKTDYTPEETVTIFGAGFAPGPITLTVTRPDEQVDSIPDVTADDEGGFTTTYVLNGILGQYTVNATDSMGQSAQTTFTDADTGWMDPSANAADAGNGFELNPTYAYSDDSNYARNDDGAGDSHRYYNYGFNIPGCATITGIRVRLQWWLDSISGNNSMSVELSWDGGTSWTAAKKDTYESPSEHETTLGSSSDTWGHTWTPGQLSNDNFRVRLTCNSDSGSRDFRLDWVGVRVYYTVTPNANTGLMSPSANAADTGGDGDGFEVNPTYAYDDGGTGYASNTNGDEDRHRYYNYGFNIPAGATIMGIEVRLDWWLSSTSGYTNYIGVGLSWNGGTDWTTVTRNTSGEPTSESTSTLGSSSDDWGHTWTLGQLSNDNFRVRLTCISSESGQDFYLDWVPVRVYYCDTTAPTVTLITPSPLLIADADVGTGKFTVTVDYSEAMDTLVAPTIAFTPGVSSTLTLNAGSSGWTDSDTYVAVYDVADAGVNVPDVDIGVTGARDVAGNTQMWLMPG